MVMSKTLKIITDQGNQNLVAGKDKNQYTNSQVSIN